MSNLLLITLCDNDENTPYKIDHNMAVIDDR